MNANNEFYVWQSVTMTAPYIGVRSRSFAANLILLRVSAPLRLRVIHMWCAYLATLTELVAKYDHEHFAADLSHIRGLDSLKYLMEHNGICVSSPTTSKLMRRCFSSSDYSWNR